MRRGGEERGRKRERGLGSNDICYLVHKKCVGSKLKISLDAYLHIHLLCMYCVCIFLCRWVCM